MLPKYFWRRAIYWSMVSLPGVTALKKTGSLFSRSHQLSAALQLGAGLRSPAHSVLEMLIGWILYRPCAGDQGCLSS